MVSVNLKVKNHDFRLVKKSTRPENYPDKCTWNPQSTARKITHGMIIKHQRQANEWKKVSKVLVSFLDMSEDLDPQWCFVTGLYIPPRKRGFEAVKPFPKGEWAYRSSYDSYIEHSNVDDKINEKSLLICIAVKGKKVVPSVPRPRIFNIQKDIINHLSSLQPNHVSTSDFVSLDLKHLRAKYFLKPSGKPFPKVR